MNHENQALLLLLCVLTGCGVNHANEGHENYLPEVRLVKADEGGFYVEWDEPLRVFRSVAIEIQRYGSDGYKAWAHHGKPIDDVEIYLRKSYQTQYSLLEFQPGSLASDARFGGGEITFIRILSVQETKQKTKFYRMPRESHNRVFTVYPSTQNYRIGEPEVLVVEQEGLNQ